MIMASGLLITPSNFHAAFMLCWQAEQRYNMQGGHNEALRQFSVAEFMLINTSITLSHDKPDHSFFVPH